jgi:adenylyl cyclase-associated protein
MDACSLVFFVFSSLTVRISKSLLFSFFLFLEQVTKDQQTWRKEYKGAAPATLQPAPTLESASTHSTNGTAHGAAAAAVVVKKKEKKTPLRGLPIFEYQDRGFKWVIENHTKETAQKEHSATNGVITIDITDPKQQVYLYNCGDVCVQVNGKFKSLVLDSCQKCSIVYDTLISSAEMVNCKRIQLQVNGVCPVFTIDKTQGVLIWLSKESTEVSNFTTSQSSEMNVSFPSKDGDQKELPIPEQFVHKICAESLTSDVSDLYH